METNPFAPPSASLDESEAVEWSDPERVRRKYLAHEVKARALGLPFLAAGVVLFTLGLLTVKVSLVVSLLVLTVFTCPSLTLGLLGGICAS